jgi:hypothetical protein
VTITIEAIFFKIRYLLLEWSGQLIFLGSMFFALFVHLLLHYYGFVRLLEDVDAELISSFPQPNRPGTLADYLQDLPSSAQKTSAHDSGSWRIANPYQVAGFHRQSFADLPRRTDCPGNPNTPIH